MKLIHLSDPHFLDLTDLPWLSALTDKRASGLANLLLKRGRSHRNEIAQSLARHIRHDDADHVVVTGDFTSLALPREVDKAVAWLREDIALPPDKLSVIPGNHDRYTKDAVSSGYFDRALTPYMRSDQPNGETFPYLRLRGPLAIIGIDTAVVQPHLVAAGRIGARQREALRSLLFSEEVRQRTPILLIHHPAIWTRSWAREYLRGLRDVKKLSELLPPTHGLILHGHQHKTLIQPLPVKGKSWLVAGAPSASSTTLSGQRAPGYNSYEFDEDGKLASVASTTLVEDGSTRKRILNPVEFRP